MWAKQSTAATLIIGPILDSAGAEYAGAVIGDLSISKNGGTLTAMAAAATLNVIANGQYTLVTTAANLDTLGRVQITCNKSTYQMPSVNLMVIPAMVFDAMVLGSDVLQTDVTQLLGTAWLVPGTAGTPDVNVKMWNSLVTVALPLVPTTAGRTLDVSSGGEAGIDWANVGSPTTTLALTGTTIGTVTMVTTTTTLTNLPAITAGWLTATGIAADAITDAKVASDVTIASVNGAVGSVTGSVGSVSGAVGSVTAAITLPTIPTDWITANGIAADAIGSSELAASAVAEILTTQMTESYAADGVAPTLAQALFLIQQALTEFSISSTTTTVKKLDGSTTAATLTLNSATVPTAVTRAT